MWAGEEGAAKGNIRRSHASSALQIVLQFGLNFQPEKSRAYYNVFVLKKDCKETPKIILYGMKTPNNLTPTICIDLVESMRRSWGGALVLGMAYSKGVTQHKAMALFYFIFHFSLRFLLGIMRSMENRRHEGIFKKIKFQLTLQRTNSAL